MTTIISMQVFVVERHLVGWTRAEVDVLVEHVAATSELMAGAGVQYLGSVVLPTDEICLSLFEASDAGAVATANATHHLRVDRVLPGWTSSITTVVA